MKTYGMKEVGVVLCIWWNFSRSSGVIFLPLFHDMTNCSNMQAERESKQAMDNLLFLASNLLYLWHR